MNGIEATRQATILYRNLIVIAVSFHSEMKYVVQMIEAGARVILLRMKSAGNLLKKHLLLNILFDLLS